jgi:DNA-binding MarR family transcriptional regulator
VDRFEAAPIITTRREVARYRGHTGCMHHGLPVTPPQADVLTEIRRHFVANGGEGPRVSDLSRRLKLTWTTVRVHLNALDRKGWIEMRKRRVIPRR